MPAFVPLYERVKERIREEFLAGPDAREGAALPTEREFQTRYQVSRPTIGRALAALAAEGLVTKGQGRGSFVGRPEPAAGGGSHARRIGFVASITSAELVQRAFRGIRRVAGRADYRVLVADGANLEAEQQAVCELIQAGVRGIVLYPALRRTGEYEGDYLSRDSLAVPVVLIDTGLPWHRSEQVAFDNRRAGYDATSYLLARGRRRIALLSWPAAMLHQPLVDRMAGFRDALADYRGAVDDDLIARCDPGRMPEELPAVLDRWLSRSEPPDAVIAPEDNAAIEVVLALQSRGVRVPDDIAVFGFDNRVEARHFRPALPTTNPDFERMGEMACSLLLDALHHQSCQPRTWVLPVPLLVRRASGVQTEATEALRQ